MPARTYNQSKFSSDSTKSFRPNLSNSETIPTQSTVPQYYSVKSPSHTRSQIDSVKQNAYHHYRQPKSYVSSTSPNQTTDQVKEPVRPVASVLARYQDKEKAEDVQTSGYKSRFREREYAGVRGPIGQQFTASMLSQDKKDEEKRKLEKVRKPC